MLDDVCKEALTRMLWKQAAFRGVEAITYGHVQLTIPGEARSFLVGVDWPIGIGRKHA